MNKRQRLSNWILIKDNSMFLVDINKNERSVKIWLNTHTHTHTHTHTLPIPIVSTRKEEKMC